MIAQAQSFYFLSMIKPLPVVAVLEPHYPVRRNAHDANQNWDYDLFWDDDMPDAYGDPVQVHQKDRIPSHIWKLMQDGADVVRVTYYVGVNKKTGECLKRVYLARNEFYKYSVKKAFKPFFDRVAVAFN